MSDFTDDADGKADLASPEILDLVSQKLQELRKRLLDFTRRNPLIHIKFRPTSTSTIPPSVRTVVACTTFESIP